MVRSRSARTVVNLGIASALSIFLGACGSMNLPSFSSPSAAPEPGARARNAGEPFVPDEIVGRWGLASLPNPNDPRAHRSRGAGAMQTALCDRSRRHRRRDHASADLATPQELRLKGSPSGKNYIGPPGPAGGEQDREIVSFDGRVLITRFTDKDAATRYGNMVYVRCAPRA